ncbi:MAG: sporulation protein YqfD [Alicyclobacillus sp.]|nr:sporulation protein YqfD [Alicyclobacillus sp.]
MTRRPRLEHLLSGYVFVELTGPGVTGVVRALARQGISLYQVRVRDGYATAGFSLADVRPVCRAARAHRVKIHFVRREGFPFLIRKLRRRKAMLFGAALFAALLYLFQSMVWQVSVVGVDPEEAAAILQAARSLGVYRGAPVAAVKNPDQLQADLIARVPNLMWVGVTRTGTHVEIQALEKIPGVVTAPAQPHNIVAARPAVIRKVFASRGKVEVKPGQAVSPGQLLVSGVLGGGAAEVPADAEVLAEVWYRTQVSVPLHVSQQALTGEAVQFDVLQMGDWNLRVWGWRDPKFASYDDRESDTTWHIGHWQLPLVLRHITRYEATPAAVRRTEQQALAEALRLAAQDVAAQPGSARQILGQTVLHTEVSRGKLYATVLTRTEEDIGMPAPIPKAPVETEKPAH